MAKERFGPYITALRESLGISKAELARRTHMTRAYIGFIEDDAQPPSMEPPNVRPHNLAALARELNVSEQEMFDRGYQPPPGFKLVSVGSGPAASLIHEVSASYEGGARLESSVVADLSSEVEDFARVRIERTMRELQAQGGR